MKWWGKLICWFGWHTVQDDGQENSPQYLRCLICGRTIEVRLSDRVK